MAVIGTVVRMVASRGFFILNEEGSDIDYFAHRDDLPGGIPFERLRVGDQMAFTPVVTPKGMRASHIMPIEAHDRVRKQVNDLFGE
jgi:cold shock CspA family protein